MRRCDMCHKPLRGEGYKLVPLLRPDLSLTVGPECYRKERKARAEMLARLAPEELARLREHVARAAGQG